MARTSHDHPSPAASQATIVAAPPSPGGDLVIRRRLLDRLREDAGKTIILQAPSGFGKSVLLEQFAAADRRPSHTVLLTGSHNDPVLLVEAIAAALAASEPLSDEVFDALQGPQPDLENVVLPRLLAALTAREQPCLLALDELERIESPDSLSVVAALVAGMPAGSQLAIAGRVEPPIRLGRLRAGRQLVELRREDLTMTKAECGSLLSLVGVELTPTQLDTIVLRTEGWPAALYLAGLALTESPDAERTLADFAGDDRLLVDYLEEEFLLPASRRRLEFLRRVSVLERMCGDLCDAVVEREGSAATLRDLARSNMLLVPLDRSDTWFRFHPLLRGMLRAELHRSEPQEEGALNLRATEWWAARGDWDMAIDHAIEAGASERAGELVWAAVPEYLTRGRIATIQAWLDRLGPEAVAADAPLSLTAYWTDLTAGRGPAAEHHAAATRRNLAAADPDGDTASIEAGLVLADATLARTGLEAMRAAIGSVEPLFPEDDPWRTLCCLIDGVGAHLSGDRGRARQRLLEAARRGSIAAPNLQSLALVQLGLLYIEARDWPAAEREIARARDQVFRYGLVEYPMVALVFAASAYIRARRGSTDAAKEDLATGFRLLGELDHFVAWYEVEARLVLARAASRLGDRETATGAIEDAARVLVEVPGDVVLAEWLAEIRAGLGDVGPAPGAPLTAAELRILQFLPGHLSYPEIAASSYLSQNTVKTHARGIYRKFGVSSRREAVERARLAGLLEAAPGAPEASR
ncbi:MAG TPA: LuxR C-terminal-related transcriptional regulator [Solirubrobacterales bacterium]|nr:LuxR C-terminal-related transcriptional regulator [Solirubrobacterales bacterium]